MEWSLPKSVKIDGKEYKIRNGCDYRVVLDVIAVLGDKELGDREKAQCALFIFYEDLTGLKNYSAAIDEMLTIIGCGEKDDKGDDSPKLMDWQQDFKHIAPPISRTLGYSVRDAEKYTHWYDFIGAYGEIGDCYWSQVVSLRQKLRDGKKLDKQDRAFYEKHKKDIILKTDMDDEDRRFLDEI